MTTGPRFTLHQAFIRGDGRYYLPLPKLNRVQRDTIAARLTRIGFRVGGGERFKAYSSAGFIHVDGSGLATSNIDLFDPLAPLIPELLRVKREKVALDDLASMYFAAKRRGGALKLRLSVRAESLGLWRKLRAEGESLLTPDESAVLKLLLKDAKGRVSERGLARDLDRGQEADQAEAEQQRRDEAGRADARQAAALASARLRARAMSSAVRPR